MKRLQLGDKILLHRNLHYLILYVVIVTFIVLYNSQTIDLQMEKMRDVWMVKTGDGP